MASPTDNTPATRGYVRSIAKRIMATLAIGYTVLVFGIGYAVHDNGTTAKDACDGLYTQAVQNRDLLQRLDMANLQSYQHGKITLAARQEAHEFYSLAISRVKDPICHTTG